MDTKPLSDKDLIEHLGGPAQVAEMLGYEKHGGVQRVTNWVTRGIPYKVKVDHADIFLSPLADRPMSATPPAAKAA